jgi:exopolysaccharide biosynthesis polyprenyl glycosylphosphotransferase
MVGSKHQVNTQLSQIIDLGLCVLAFWLSYYLRLFFPSLPFFSGAPISDDGSYGASVWLVAPFAPLLLERFGFYDHTLQKKPWPWLSIKQIIKAFIIIFVFIGVLAIFGKKTPDSRAVLACQLVFSALLLLIKEWIVRLYLRTRMRSENYRERVLLAGSVDALQALQKTWRSETLSGFEIVDTVDLEKQSVENLIEIMHDQGIERVVLAGGHVHFDKIQHTINACEVEGVEVWLWTDFIKTTIAKPNFDTLAGEPMLVLRSTPEDSWSIVMKRIMDIVVSLLALVFIFTFVWWWVAWGIRRQSPGAVIFAQRRSGKNGKPFVMYKFRTMGLDAEARKSELAAQNEMSGPVFKITHDPRVFSFGSWLRKMSIDELPQFINVLKGEMSLVGPRPLPVNEVARIEEYAQRRRLSVKPGLTCLWQVSGRSSITSFEDWVRLDLQYIDNWSLGLDVKILLMTVPAVLRSAGAK